MGNIHRHPNALTPVADYATEFLHWMGATSLLQAIMAGEASFHLAGNNWPQFFHPRGRMGYGFESVPYLRFRKRTFQRCCQFMGLVYAVCFLIGFPRLTVLPDERQKEKNDQKHGHDQESEGLQEGGV
jgi:hypothetical protein